MLLFAAVALLAMALLTASRNTRVYATVNSRQIDCGTWNEQTVEPGCFGRFGKFELAQIVFPLVAAFAACIVGLRLLQLLQPQGAFAVGEVVSLRRLHPFDAKRFAETLDARAVTANHMAAGDAKDMRWMCRWLAVPQHAAVCDRVTGTIVGGVSLLPDVSVKPFAGEIGVWIASQWSGRGYGGDAIRVFSQSLLRRGFSPVTAETDVANAGMRALLEKCSFVALEFHQREMPDGTTLDVVRYQLAVGAEPNDVPAGYVAADIAPLVHSPESSPFRDRAQALRIQN